MQKRDDLMKSKFILLLLVLPLVFSGCSKEDKTIKPYISILASNLTATNESNLLIYYYDFETENVEKVSSIDNFSQYSLAVYSKADNTIYYSQRIENENLRGDQLFSLNLDTNETKQLTNNIFAINYIIPSKDKVYLLAVTVGDRHLKPMIYHKDTEELEILSKDTDLNFERISYDIKQNHLYASGAYLKEIEKAIDDYNNAALENPDRIYVSPDYYIYDFSEDFNNPKQLLKTDKTEITALSAVQGDKKIFYTHTDGYGKFNYIFDINKNTKIPYSSEIVSQRNFCFLNEDETVFIGEDSSNLTEYPRGVYLYNSKTNETKLLFSTDDGYILNFQLLAD